MSSHLSITTKWMVSLRNLWNSEVVKLFTADHKPWTTSGGAFGMTISDLSITTDKI